VLERKIELKANTITSETVSNCRIKGVNLMNRTEFEAKLNKVYGGKVKALQPYLNKYAVIVFHCEQCNQKFFNKPAHMVGNKEAQRHMCDIPYGDIFGNRVANIHNARFHTSKKKEKEKEKAKEKAVNVAQRLNDLIEQGLSYKQIAKKLDINSNIVKAYMTKEGL
jgi:2,3-bisphosphoglycerate-independent phosphoglycerate mutase